MVDLIDMYATATTASDPTNLTYDVTLTLYESRTNLSKTNPVNLDSTNYGLFAEWLNGLNGDPLPIIYNLTAITLYDTALEILITVNRGNSKSLNLFDLIEVTKDGTKHTFRCKDFDLLPNIRNFDITDTPDSTYLQQRVNSVTVANPTLNNINVDVALTHDVDAFDMWITAIEGIDFTVILPFPILINPARFQQSFNGTIENIEEIFFVIQVARYGDQFVSRRQRASFQGSLPVLPTPEPLPIPNYSVQLENFIVTAGGLAQADIIYIPEVPLDQFESVTTRQERTMPNPDRQGSRQYTNHVTRTLIFQAVEEGSFYNFWVQLVLINGTVISSPIYPKTIVDGLVIDDIANFSESQIQYTKIYVQTLKPTSVSFRLINELFNNDGISNLRVVYTDRVTEKELNKQINNTSDTVEIEILGITHNTLYDFTFYATIDGMEIEIEKTSLKTLEELGANPTPERIRENTMKEIIRTSYDSNEANMLEGLNTEEMSTIVCNIIDRKNDPAVDGLIRDFNRRNKYGSQENAGRSPYVTANYNQSLAQLIQSAVVAVPDVDEGYRI